jgi:hypothetical protein
MNLSDRDRRALLLLIVALGAAAVFYFLPQGEQGGVVTAASDTKMLEQRLEKSHALMVQVPDKQAQLRQARADLAVREKGLIVADTAAQAQAQLFQILRRIGRAQNPPIDIRANEIGQARPFGDAYGEVTVSISLECGIEQLVNLLADLGAQPELLATSEIHVGQASGPQKLIPVRLLVPGLVPRKLIPEKKGASF